MARNRQLTESRIREAALLLLHRDGFEGWGVNAIAREAGVDKVLIYRYFGSVDDLLGEIIQATRFWPDPDSLPDHSPEAFLAATLEALAGEQQAQVLLSHPSARAPVSDIRRKFTADLDRWMSGFRRNALGSISEDQFERLPALLYFQAATGRDSLSPRDLWKQLSPPLRWTTDAVRAADEELPPELL